MEKVGDFFSKNLTLFLLASVTLGLAPFSPEPHIVGKLRWVSGGAVGMKGADWFDLVMHGTPWVLLIFALAFKAKKVLQKAS